MWELDLTTTKDQQSLLKVLHHKDTKYIHFGPPCGIFSRAREIPLSDKDKRKAGKEPQPLRTEQEPYGLERNWGRDRKRVEAANKLVKFIGEAVPALHAKRKYFTIENPGRSIMWWTDEMKKIQKLRTIQNLVLN